MLKEIFAGALINTISSETAIVIIQLITLYSLDRSASFKKGGEILLFSTCNVGCNLTKADQVTECLTKYLTK